MQNKYIDEKKYHVQVAENLYMKKNNSDEKYKTNIVVILDYNINDNITEYNILFDESIDKDNRAKILSKHTGEFNKENNFVTFSVSGLSKFL
jgi:hypothetical protein